jgi:hypothetical protein
MSDTAKAIPDGYAMPTERYRRYCPKHHVACAEAVPAGKAAKSVWCPKGHAVNPPFLIVDDKTKRVVE